MGGRARAEKYSRHQLTAWAKLGVRKPKLTEKEWARLLAMLRAGTTQPESAREFNTSARTIGRTVARRNADREALDTDSRCE